MPAFDYPLDPTGLSPGNLKTNELHDLPPSRLRAFATDAGAFFAESMIITDVATGLPLTLAQYYVAERYELPTVKYRKTVCAVVVITDPAVSNRVSVNYQVLGGFYQQPATEVVNQFSRTSNTVRPSGWGNILKGPTEWPTEELQHDTALRQGFEYPNHAMQRIAEVIERGDENSHDNVRNYARAQINRVGGNSELAMQILLENHTTKVDPHPGYLTVSELNSILDIVSKPKNVSPADGATDVLYNNLTLTAGLYGAMYAIPQGSVQFQVAADNGFNNIVVDRIVPGTSATTVLTNLNMQTRYYWRMRYANLEGARSAWSDATTFLTSLTYISAPSIASPGQDQLVSEAAPTFTTSAFNVVGGSDTHQSTDWELWTGPNGTGTLRWSSYNDNVNKTSVTLPSGITQVSSNYYLRSRHTGSTYGLSAWSGYRHFTTPASYLPTVIGQAYGGGYYGGDITIGADRYLILVSPKASGETSKYLTGAGDTPGADSQLDSVSNTNYLKVYGSSPSADWATNYRGGGFADWQVPAIEVLRVLRTNLSPLGANTPAIFKTGGTEAFSASQYWSSTTHDFDYNYQYTTGGEPIYSQRVKSRSEHGRVNSYPRGTAGSFPAPGSCSVYEGEFEPGRGEVFYSGETWPGGMDQYYTFWDCVFYEQYISGYTPIEYHSGTDHASNGYVLGFDTANGASQELDKNTTKALRPVRLIKV